MSQQKAVWDALHSLLVTNLTGVTVSQGDWTQVDRGTSVVVLSRPAGWSSLSAPFSTARRVWRFIIEVYAADDTTVATQTDTVVGVLEDYPTLNGHSGVTEMQVGEASEPEPVMDTRGGGPYYVRQSFLVEVEQQYVLSGGEYA